MMFDTCDYSTRLDEDSLVILWDIQNYIGKEKYDFLIHYYNFERLRDTLKDGWNMFSEAKVIRDFGDKEEAKQCLNDILTRLNHSDTIRVRIKNYMDKNNIAMEGAYEVLYDGILEDLDSLKEKIKYFTL